MPGLPRPTSSTFAQPQLNLTHTENAVNAALGRILRDRKLVRGCKASVRWGRAGFTVQLLPTGTNSAWWSPRYTMPVDPLCVRYEDISVLDSLTIGDIKRIADDIETRLAAMCDIREMYHNTDAAAASFSNYHTLRAGSEDVRVYGLKLGAFILHAHLGDPRQWCASHAETGQYFPIPYTQDICAVRDFLLEPEVRSLDRETLESLSASGDTTVVRAVNALMVKHFGTKKS